jgi:hypothetical protein
MSGFLVWIGVVVATVVGSNHVAWTHLHRLEQTCQCICRAIHGFEAVPEDLAAQIALAADVTVDWYPWFSSPIACAASDRPDGRRRLSIVQRETDKVLTAHRSREEAHLP